MCIHVYMCVYVYLPPSPPPSRIIPRWPNWNLSLPRDKKRTTNFVLANPSTRELCRKIVVEFQLLPENTTRATENPMEQISANSYSAFTREYFSYKYNRVI